MLILTLIAALVIIAPLAKSAYHAIMAITHLSYLDKELAINYLFVAIAMSLLVAMFAAINYLVNMVNYA